MAAGLYPPNYRQMPYTCDDCGSTASTLIGREKKYYCLLCVGKHPKRKPERKKDKETK